MNRHKLAAISLVPVILLGLLVSCKTTDSTEVYRETEFLFNTEVFIEAYGKDAEKAGKKAMEIMEKIDRAANRYSDNSEITKLNKAAGKQPIALSKEMYELLHHSLELAELTEGMFEPTIGPLVQTWQTAKEKESLPMADIIEEQLQLVDYKKVILDSRDKTAFLLEPGMSMDLGAVTKGFAVKKGMTVLREAGITSAIIRAGGNVYTIGTKPDGSKWRIGIRDPLNPEKTIGYLEPDNQVIDTSGNYEQYFNMNSQAYGHIINPRTGYPADTVAGCTIITDQPSLADALSTAAFILGSDKGIDLVEAIPNTEGIIISNDGQTYMSSGFEKMLKYE